jgi:hypothetical protein
MIKAAKDNLSDMKNLSSDPKVVIKDLNGFFISHFLKLMYDTVDVANSDESVLGQSSGEKIFREFLLNEYGDIMSEKFQLTNDMISQYLQNSKNGQTLPLDSESTIDVKS